MVTAGFFSQLREMILKVHGNGGPSLSTVTIDGVRFARSDTTNGQRPNSLRLPNANDVEALCTRIREHKALKDLSLLRIYFYHGPPFTGVERPGIAFLWLSRPSGQDMNLPDQSRSATLF